MGISKATFILLLPKIVGQVTASKNLQPANKKMIGWNILYIVIYFFIFAWTLYSTPNKEDKYGYKGFVRYNQISTGQNIFQHFDLPFLPPTSDATKYHIYRVYWQIQVWLGNNLNPENWIFKYKKYSFISQIKYCVHLYGTSGFLFFINIRVTYYRNDIRHVYKRLFEMLIDFKNLGIPKRHDEFDYVFFMQTALLLSTVIALVIDIIQTPRPVSMFLWICLYIPGFSCVVYVCDYVAMFSGCAKRFSIINRTLEEYAYPDLTCSEVYSLRKNNIRPYPLLKTIPKENINMLDKLFLLHDETCELTQLLNKTCGAELLIFFGLTSTTIISLGYTSALDLIALSHDDPVSEANTRACDFWGVINIFGLMAITVAAGNVKQNYESTTKVLHRLINIYSDLQEFGDIYSLQLSHQNATVTAMGFFTVDKTIILGLLSAWATYLIILIQFSE